jgi:hypothetical protein
MYVGIGQVGGRTNRGGQKRFHVVFSSLIPTENCGIGEAKGPEVSLNESLAAERSGFR